MNKVSAYQVYSLYVVGIYMMLLFILGREHKQNFSIGSLLFDATIYTLAYKDWIMEDTL